MPDTSFIEPSTTQNFSTIDLDSSDASDSLTFVVTQNFENVEAGRQAAGFEEPLSAAAFARGRGLKRPKSGNHDGRLSGSEKSNSMKNESKVKSKKGKKSKKRFWKKGSKSKKSKKKRNGSKSKKSKKSRKDRIKGFFSPKLRPHTFVEVNWPLLDVFILVQLFMVFAFIANAALFTALELSGVVPCITFAVILGVSAVPSFFLIAKGEVESAISVFAAFQLTAGFFGFLLLIRYFVLAPWFFETAKNERDIVYDILWVIVAWQFVSTLFASWTPYKPVNSRMLKLLSSQSGADIVVRSRCSHSSQNDSKKSKKKHKKTRSVSTKKSSKLSIPKLPIAIKSKHPESSHINATSNEPLPRGKHPLPASTQLEKSATTNTSGSDLTVYRKKF